MVSLLKRTSDPLCNKIGLDRYSVVIDALKPRVRALVEKGYGAKFTGSEELEAVDDNSEDFCDNVIENLESLTRIPGLGDHTVAIALAELFPDKTDSLVV